ncbi:MAG: hypothetical protein OHK0038_22510 [Flammeovirgaceae bacterium]
MKNKKKDEEDKIIEEIKKRVFEEEEKMKKVSDREAFIEALDQVSELNKSQILAIEAQVRKEYAQLKQKEKEKKQKLFAIAIVVFIVMGLIAWRIYEKVRPPKIVTILKETFDHNNSNWLEQNIPVVKRTNENGELVFSTNKASWCYWDEIDVSLPVNFTLEVASVWKEGNHQGMYGVMIMQDDDNYGLFQLTGTGDVSYCESINDVYSSFQWKKNKSIVADGYSQNIQRIEIQDLSYTYYVNNQFVEQGMINSNFKLQQIGLRVCDIQKVAFTYVKITDTDNNRIVFEEDFDNPKPGWEFIETYTESYALNNGVYELKLGEKDRCHFSTIAFPYYSYNNDLEITAECKWQSGDNDSFGLLITQDDQNSLNFEIKKDGNARITKYINSNYTTITTFRTTKHISNGNNSIIQKVKINKNGTFFEYYVNETLVEKGTVDIQIYNIGFRACGEQTVHFDNLEIKEIEVKD